MKKIDDLIISFFQPVKHPPRISISAKSYQLYFYQEAVAFMNIELGDRVNLLMFNGGVFIYKAETGFKVHYNSKTDGRLKTQMRSVMPAICARLNIKTTMTFEIRKTNYEYKESQLFEIILPYNKRL